MDQRHTHSCLSRVRAQPVGRSRCGAESCDCSGGDYTNACISRWTQDTLSLIRNVVEDPVIIVGSGVGGWVMLQVALQIPKQVRVPIFYRRSRASLRACVIMVHSSDQNHAYTQVKGLVGIAADPDFTVGKYGTLCSSVTCLRFVF